MEQEELEPHTEAMLLVQVGEEEGGEDASVSSQDERPSCWGRLVSLCSALRRTWFLKESIMLFKLTLPLVSDSLAI